MTTKEQEEAVAQALQDERIRFLERRMDDLEKRITEMREGIIRPILAWQNRAVGSVIGLSAIASLLWDWITDHIDGK